MGRLRSLAGPELQTTSRSLPGAAEGWMNLPLRTPLASTGEAWSWWWVNGVIARDFAPLYWGALQAVVNIFLHRKMGEQAGFLKHITQCPLMGGKPLLAGVVLPDSLVDGDAALGAFKPGQAAQAGCFAAAGGAEQGSDAMAG